MNLTEGWSSGLSELCPEYILRYVLSFWLFVCFSSEVVILSADDLVCSLDLLV